MKQCQDLVSEGGIIPAGLEAEVVTPSDTEIKEESQTIEPIELTNQGINCIEIVELMQGEEKH